MSLRFRRALIVALVLGCLLPTRLTAQQAVSDGAEGTSEIAGKILSADGKPVAGVRVMVYHLSTERLFASEPTSANGSYALADLPYGYFDVAVETPDGMFVADQVVNLPPSGKVGASLNLAPYEDTGAQPPREFSGTNLESIGWARVKEKARGKAFWKSSAGIAILAGVGGVALLALAVTGSDDDEQPASPM